MLADLLSAVFVLAGGFFLVVGGIGLIRLPDLFSRLHAAGITDTLGLGLFVVGFMCQAGLSAATAKLALVLLFLLLTGPVATHALAKAALHGGLRPRLAEPASSPVRAEIDPPWNT